jgi:hypothetical protein
MTTLPSNHDSAAIVCAAASHRSERDRVDSEMRCHCRVRVATSHARLDSRRATLAPRKLGTCNKCGNQEELVLSGLVCGPCNDRLDRTFAQAAVGRPRLAVSVSGGSSASSNVDIRLSTYLHDTYLH